jgi:hypothetical protein
VEIAHQALNGPVPAVILTTQRTGSSFLVECLDSHPELFVSGEILEGMPDRPGRSYRGPFKQVVKIGNMIRRGAWYPPYRLGNFYAGKDGKVRIFKAMYNQLERPFALRFLQGVEELRVIHLSRLNLLKVYVSTVLMPKRRSLQVVAPTDPIWIRVDPRQAVGWMREARASFQRFDDAFARQPRLHVHYEDLFDGPRLQADTGRRICDFLGVTQHAMQSKVVKMNPESLRDMVTNYDEVAQAIAKTEFADMLA